MKKQTLLPRKPFVILLALLSSIYVGAIPAQATIKQGTIEFVMGNYNLDEPRFTAIYEKGGPIAGLILSSTLVSDFNFYLEIKYFAKTGKLTYSKEKTRMALLPVSLGLRYILPIGFFHPYAGGGGDFYIYYENNPIGTVLNYTNGYHALGGFYLQFGKLPLMMNVKVKYTRAMAEESGKKIQLGGLEYGAGFVIAF